MILAGCSDRVTFPSMWFYLGLVEGKEQGRLREKLALVAVLRPYHQAPQVCQMLLGSERHATTLRRVALREAEQLAASGHQHTLPLRERDRIYLQVNGQLCPTREERQSAEDQGYREAKAVLAFSAHDVAEVSKERHELLAKVLRAKVTDSEEFRTLFTQVYQQAQGQSAAEVIVLADGARGIWALAEDLVPHAIQILDFSHAKHYLWEAAKILYGEDSAFLRACGSCCPCIPLPFVPGAISATIFLSIGPLVGLFQQLVSTFYR